MHVYCRALDRQLGNFDRTDSYKKSETMYAFTTRVPLGLRSTP